LNDEQLNVVVARRPIMVVAAPGSGKTATVVERIRYNIEDLGMKPWRILALTFTNVAANEIKARSGYEIESKTIHSWCYKQLAIEGLNAKVAHPMMFKNFVDAEAMPANIDRQEIADTIQFVRLGLIKLEDIKREIRDIVRPLKDKYEYSLRKKNLIDFTDMLGMMHKRLRDDSYANRMAAKYDEVIIDEAQDLDRVQLEIIRRLTRNYSNVVFVGDPDQSIYGFLGAMPDMGSTANKYGIPILTLNKTYRYGEELGDMSSYLINQTRRSVKNEVNCGSRKTQIVFSLFDLDIIKKMGYREEDVVILNRTNVQATGAAEKVNADVMRLPSLKIRDKMAYTMCMVDYADSRDPVALKKLLLQIKGFGPKTVEQIARDATDESIKKSFDVGITKAFGITRKNLVRALEYVDYDIVELRDGCFVPGFTMFMNTPEYLRNVIDRFEGEKLDYVRDVMFNKQLMGTSSITVHAAKGMEFPVVYVHTAGEDIASGVRDMDEEMRISYVAITRARDLLIIDQNSSMFKNYLAEYLIECIRS
jgi:DNA helicase-2/ATP-dependent DNA helicase PcrA